MKTIQRVIFVNNIEDIDTLNIGAHFTSDLSYTHKGGGSSGGTNAGKKYKVTFLSTEYVINEEATLISNTNYPKESEVVLEANQQIAVEMRVQIAVDGGFGYPSKSKITGNVGERCDVWVKNL